MDTCICMHGVTWHFNSKIKKSKTHETLVDVMSCHSLQTYACVHVVRQICLKIPSNLLHIELTHTQVHKYDFSNRFG